MKTIDEKMAYITATLGYFVIITPHAIRGSRQYLLKDQNENELASGASLTALVDAAYDVALHWWEEP